MVRLEMSFVLTLAVIVASGLQVVSGSDDFKDDELIRFLVKNRLYKLNGSGQRNWCGGKNVSHPESGKAICICERGTGFSRYDSRFCEACYCGEGEITCSFRGSKKCYCEAGYKSKDGKCNQDVCYENPCQNGGTCWRSRNLKSFKCLCSPGYTGTNCETEINPCDFNICENGGTCYSRAGSKYWCDCPANFTGDRCDLPDHEYGCTGVCENGGTCYTFSIFHACLCPETRTGQYCEKEIDPCDPNPCKNGAFCFRRNGIDRYCECQDGFSGKDCSIHDENTCLNGGTCWLNPRTSTYCDKCICARGYTGDHCETVINPCENNICQNGGTCYTRPGNTHWCDCPSNYTGDRCDTTVHGCIDENPCWYGATCYKQDDKASYACLCPETRTGQHCETEIDPCTPNPCKNGGECYRRTGLDHMCVCKNGFSGKDCSIQNSRAN